MEILLIILAFLFGVSIGMLACYLLLKWLQQKMMKKAFAQMGMGGGLDEMFKAIEHLVGGKKRA